MRIHFRPIEEVGAAQPQAEKSWDEIKAQPTPPDQPAPVIQQAAEIRPEDIPGSKWSDYGLEDPPAYGLVGPDAAQTRPAPITETPEIPAPLAPPPAAPEAHRSNKNKGGKK